MPMASSAPVQHLFFLSTLAHGELEAAWEGLVHGDPVTLKACAYFWAVVPPVVALPIDRHKRSKFTNDPQPPPKTPPKTQHGS